MLIFNISTKMKGIGNTTTDNFASIMSGTKKYLVPKFQRDYSWEEENWEELWNDIMFAIDEEDGEHYMGYLVLLQQPNEMYHIIDGQQRLTTISILILSVLHHLTNELRNEPNVGERVAELKNSYIGKRSPIKLTIEHKLTLNRNNTTVYKRLIGNENLPKKLTSTESLMSECFKYFNKQIASLKWNGVGFASFVESITSKIYFTKITVTDDLNAYKVFETLNSTGVKLSSTDLLKNYLFQVVDGEMEESGDNKEEHLKELDDKWAYIATQLENDDFPDFLRAYWNGRKKVEERKNLYKAIRKEIKTAEQAFELVKNLEQCVEVYKGIITPKTNFFADFEISENLTILKLFKVIQPVPLLLVAFEKFGVSNEFKKVLRDCVVFSFRYNVICGLNPNKQQDVYNKTSLELLNKGKYILTEIKAAYPDDETFLLNFSKKEFKRNTQNLSIVRLILTRIESKISNKSHSFTDSNITIEHIVPEKNKNNEWGLSDDEHKLMVFKIGNHTLLSKGNQDKAGNKPYNIKRGVYSSSGYEVTKRLADNFEKWDAKAIDENQKWIGEQAKANWSINFPNS